jgi:homoprotocatechuate degradation regulator HpaR
MSTLERWVDPRDMCGMDDPVSFRRTNRSLPIALLRARETVMGPIRVMLATSGLNEQKWRILRVLDEGGPLELTHLATEACLLLPSLTRIIRPMQVEGLIARHTPLTDKRKGIVAITDKGRQVILDHAAANAAIVADLQASFGAERLELLLDLLDALQKPDNAR